MMKQNAERDLSFSLQKIKSRSSTLSTRPTVTADDSLWCTKMWIILITTQYLREKSAIFCFFNLKIGYSSVTTKLLPKRTRFSESSSNSAYRSFEQIQNSRFFVHALGFVQNTYFNWNLMKITKIILYGVISFGLLVLNAICAVHAVCGVLIHRHNPLHILCSSCASFEVYMSFISYLEQYFTYS